MICEQRTVAFIIIYTRRDKKIKKEKYEENGTDITRAKKKKCNKIKAKTSKYADDTIR